MRTIIVGMAIAVVASLGSATLCAQSSLPVGIAGSRCARFPGAPATAPLSLLAASAASTRPTPELGRS